MKERKMIKMRKQARNEITKWLKDADFALVIVFNDDDDENGYDITTLYPREQDSPDIFKVRLDDAIDQLTEIRNAVSEF